MQMTHSAQSLLKAMRKYSLLVMLPWMVSCNSVYYWVIATLKQIYWYGAGPVPGPAEFAHTGHAKGFGGLLAFQFLLHYCRYHKIVWSPLQPLTGLYYCDNKGMIQHVDALLKLQIRSPTLTIWDDFDLYFQITKTVKDLKDHLSLSVLHVKGHQDDHKLVEELSYQAQLNVECDMGAAEFFPMFQHLSTSQPMPCLPASLPTLLIHGEVVESKLVKHMHAAAMTQDYHEYLCKKFQWTDEQCDSIQWSALQTALQHFPQPDQQWFHKFLHDWLPLNAFLQKQESHLDPMCPSCQLAPKDHWHFLECKHGTWCVIFNNLHDNLCEFFEQTKTPKELQLILYDGLKSIWES